MALFNNGFTLYESELPPSAKIGEALPVTFSWGSASGSHEDTVQFLHLRHEDSGAWWGYDQQPLGARLPATDADGKPFVNGRIPLGRLSLE
ncbi:MAG: hypothetical protein OXI34_00160 [Chloroflexota bacterium]|nr:hypothetical protein [Chloroflexota bacterium]MDE2948827.1 hypothetical protein [Chloroflexota bacterium]